MSTYGDDRLMVDQFPCPVCGRIHHELELKRQADGSYRGICATRRRPFVVNSEGILLKHE